MDERGVDARVRGRRAQAKTASPRTTTAAKPTATSKRRRAPAATPRGQTRARKHRSGVAPGQLSLDRDPWAEGVGEVLDLLVGAGLGRRAFGMPGLEDSDDLHHRTGELAEPHGPLDRLVGLCGCVPRRADALGRVLEVPLAGGDRHDAGRREQHVGGQVAAHRPFDRGSMAACEYQEVGVVDHCSVVQTAQQRGRADHVDVHGGAADAAAAQPFEIAPRRTQLRRVRRAAPVTQHHPREHESASERARQPEREGERRTPGLLRARRHQNRRLHGPSSPRGR